MKKFIPQFIYNSFLFLLCFFSGIVLSVSQLPPCNLNITTTTISPSCYSLSDGQVLVKVLNQDSNLTYQWDDSFFQTDTLATNLLAGLYTVTITDTVIQCDTSLIVNISQPDSLINSFSIQEPLCYKDCNGLITANVSGGISPYQYLWNDVDSQMTPSATNLCSGQYVVIISDSNNCILIDSIVLSEPTDLKSSLSDTSLLCYGDCNGILTVTMSGGTTPYKYLWNDSNNQTLATASGLCSGNYIVEIIDSNQCVIADTAVIDQPTQLLISGAITQPLCNGDCNGEVSTVVSGGTPGYSYLWDNNPTLTSGTLGNLCDGTYNLLVTDNNGCIDSSIYQIIEPLPLTVTLTQLSNGSCNSSSQNDGITNVSGGTTPYFYQWSTSPVQITDTAYNLAAGNYIAVITDNNGCVISESIDITDPTPIVISNPIVTQPSCDLANGKITISAYGGQGTLNYTWNTTPVQTGNTIDKLLPGVYTVVITDSTACMDSATITLTNSYNAINLNIINTISPSCYGSADGEITVNLNGNTSTSLYTWNTNPVQTSSTATGLYSGTYVITASDTIGCTIIDTIKLDQPPKLVVNTSTIEVSCNSLCDGEIYVQASGGTYPYYYNWNSLTPLSIDSVIGVCAGSYTLIVTDSNSCSATKYITIFEPDEIIASFTDNPVSCVNKSDGSSTVNISGGTSPYSYLWNTSPAQTTQTVTSLDYGTYMVSITDSAGCIDSFSTTITKPDSLSIDFTIGNASCYSDCDGSVTAIVKGGTSPYLYNWATSPIQTTATATNLCEGNFILNVTDNNGCSISDSATVTQPNAVVISSFASDASCGVSDGSVKAIVSGGTSPYNYKWNNNSSLSSDSLNNLSSGQYTLIITDSNNCLGYDTLIVNQTNPVIITSYSTTDESCLFNDGTATIMVSGGSGSYSYEWSTSPIQYGVTATNLQAGSYQVTVYDQNNVLCYADTTITINPPPTLGISFNFSDPSCDGNADGYAEAVPTGGNSPYSYIWNSNPSLSTALISNLSAGTYQVSVTDFNGCIETDSIVISDPQALTSSISVTNISCYGKNNGVASVSVSGGNLPYIYLWDDLSSQTSASATNLASGWYSVTITDKKGCATIDSVEVTEPDSVSINTTVTNPLCYNSCNGSAITSVSGGTGPFSFEWNTSPIQSSDTATNLCDGTFQITVADVNGCSISESIVVTEPDEIKLTIDTLPPTCGMDNGEAYAIASGGTGNISYQWSTNPVQYGDTAKGLEPGAYIVTVTDENACKETDMVILSTMQKFYVSDIKVNMTRCDTCDGNIEVIVDSGGVAPYSFLWGSGDTTNFTEGLCNGSHVVQITDSNGCDTTISFDIQKPEDVTLDGIHANAQCGINDGEATVTVLTGTAPFSYLWSDSITTTTTLSNIGGGTYAVNVVDSLGCKNSLSFAIYQPNPLVLNTSSSPVSCGAINGSAVAIVSGGSGNYTYQWNNGSTDSVISSLDTGYYNISISDTNSCTASDTIYVNGTASLAVNASVTPTSCGLATGSIYLSVSGGDENYTYLWENSANVSDSAIGLSNGKYIVHINDSSGCNKSDTVEVYDNDSISYSLKYFDISCYNDSNGFAYIDGITASGAVSISWMSGLSTADTISGLDTGTYHVSLFLTNNSQCIVSDTFIISQPDSLSFILSSNNLDCYNINTGKIWSEVTGGTAPYSYSWTNSVSNTDSAINLAAGTYTLTISDSNNCFASDSVVLIQPDSIITSLSASNISCGGANDGIISAGVSGGTTPFQYSWNTSPIQNSNKAVNLSAGNYTVTITDYNGCVQQDSAEISEPDTIVLASKILWGNCSDTSTHKALITASGGSGIYSYEWNTSPPQYNDTVLNLIAGTYIVKATDSIGCPAYDTIVVPQLITLVNTQSSNISCFGVNDGSITVEVIGGLGNYTYTWSADSSLNKDSIDKLLSGIHYVTVKDTVGCEVNDTITITEPAQLNMSLNSINASCGSANGEVSSSITGGSMPYSYLWNNGKMNSNIDSLYKGIYYVDVYDTNGCMVSDTAEITEANPITLTFSTTNVSCNGFNDASVTVSAAGGSGAYNYLWSNGSTSNSVFSLAPGSYAVTVTDITSNLCFTSDSVTLTEPQPISLTTSFSNTCSGTTDGKASVNVKGGTIPYSFLWSTGDTTDTISNIAAGTYVVIVSDSNNCQDAATIQISQPSSIFYLYPDVYSAYCSNYNGSIYLDVYSTSPLTYYWQDDSTNNSTDFLNADSGNYIVSIVDTFGCSVSDTITVNNFDYFPNASITKVNDISCYGGDNGKAYITGSGGGGSGIYTYSWNTIPIQTSDTATQLKTDTIIASVTDDYGCSASDTVVINEPQPIEANLLAKQISCYNYNDGKVVAVPSGGTSPYTFFWSTSSTIDSINLLSTGIYYIDITDSNNCIANDSITITEPDALVIDSSLTNMLSCKNSDDGEIILFVSGGTIPYNYFWPVTSGTDSTSTGLWADTFNVIVTDSNLCIAKDTFVISEPDSLKLLSSTSMMTTCNPVGEASISGTGGTLPYKYYWPAYADSDSVASGLLAGYHQYIISDKNGCIYFDSVFVDSIPSPEVDSITVIHNTCFNSDDASISLDSISGAGPFTILWSSINLTESSIKGLKSGTYYYIVTDTNNCSVSDSIKIIEPDSITISTSDTVIICYGQSTSLNILVEGGNGIYEYVWNNSLDSLSSVSISPTDTSFYTVIVKDSNNCSSDSVSISVFVKPPLSVKVSEDTSICSGDTLILFALASGGDGGPYNYSWNNGSESGDSIVVSALSTTKYQVKVSDNCGSLNVSDSVDLIVNPLPETSMLLNNTNGCVPLTVDFNQLTDIGDSLIWNFGDGNSSDSIAPKHTYTYPGNYTVTLISYSSVGCKSEASNTLTIEVYDTPDADFKPHKDTVKITESVIRFFDNSSYDVYEWYWNFGDTITGENNNSIEINPLHVFSDTGTFIISLQVINSNGCLDTIYHSIYIEDDFTMYIPNTFTPNDDGINDFFFPVGYGMKEDKYAFMIFDRWGNVIFESFDPNDKWDAKTQTGLMVPNDVYVWKLRVTTIYGEIKNYIGRVTVSK